MSAQLIHLEAASLSGGASSEAIRHIMEASSLLRTVMGLLSSVQELERAWSSQAERSTFDFQMLEQRYQDVRRESLAKEEELFKLRREVTNREGEVSSLRAQLSNAAGEADAARAEVFRITQDAESRVSRLLELKATELDSWKASYQEEMRRYVESRMEEVRSSTIREQEAATEAALSRMETEYRGRVAEAQGRLEGLHSEVGGLRRELSELERRAGEAETRGSSLATENSRLSHEISSTRSDLHEARASASSLSEEVSRLRALQALERATHEEMVRVHALQARHEAQGAQAAALGALDEESQKHKNELDRVQRAYDMAVRSREEAISDWRARYASAAARAEHAESLVKAIDRQLAPVALSASYGDIPGAGYIVAASNLASSSALTRSYASLPLSASLAAATMRSPPRLSPTHTSTFSHLGSSATTTAASSSTRRSPVSFTERAALAARVAAAHSNTIAAVASVASAAATAANGAK